jgi:hypothetical protein
MKRTIIVGIVFLVLSTTCLPVLASEGKPDLIVEVIGFTRKDVYSPVVAYATIENIGNATIENGTFYLEYVFTRMVLGIIPIITRNDTVWIQMNGSLEPEELLAFVNIVFVRDLPKFGFFEFKCTVNPGFTIEESNYDNNDLAKNYIVILGHWKPIE